MATIFSNFLTQSKGGGGLPAGAPLYAFCGLAVGPFTLQTGQYGVYVTGGPIFNIVTAGQSVPGGFVCFLFQIPEVNNL